jgi:osmotically inducible protein OsmC
MATTRKADAHWEGSLLEGKGQVTFGSSNLGTHEVTWASRAEDPDGRTSPEELIAGAHSTCYSMSLSLALARNDTPADSIDTHAEVDFQPGQGITGIRLTVRASVPGVTADQFAGFAEEAKNNCPVSKALTGTTITLDAALT